MYGVRAHTHTQSDLHMCLCLCAMFVLPVGICSDFELLLCFARQQQQQQQQHRQHFCNRCQRRVVCFLTCFAVGCAHVLIDYMSAAQDTAGNGTKGGCWLTTAAAWTYNVLNVHMHRIAYSHIYRVCIESTPPANRGTTTGGNLQLIKQIATANEIQSSELETPQQMELQPAAAAVAGKFQHRFCLRASLLPVAGIRIN